jgi:hypothetical protein
LLTASLKWIFVGAWMNAAAAAAAAALLTLRVVAGCWLLAQAGRVVSVRTRAG